METNETEWKKVGSELKYKSLREKDDFVIGVLLERTASKLYPKQENYTLDIGEGVRVSVTGSTVLKTKMQDVQLGQRVKIVCLGTKKGEESTYKYIDFEVYTA